MSNFFYISKLAMRLEDGSIKELPYKSASDFSYGSNFTIVGDAYYYYQGAINRKGEELIPVKYIKLDRLLKDYRNIIDVIDNRFVIGEKNGKYGAVDLEEMKKIFEMEYDAEEIVKKISEYNEP